jgi:outer membrane lipoprotein-sorting protein
VSLGHQNDHTRPRERVHRIRPRGTQVLRSAPMGAGRGGMVGAVVALGVLVLAAPLPAPAQPPSTGQAGQTPVRILLSMERAYRTCRSYRDSGVVTSTILTDGGRAGSERPFRTAFVRPGWLRFQFTDPGLGERSSSYIVWSDGTQVRSWWDAQPGVRNPGSVYDALAVAAGISGGSSVRVPSLLLPQEFGGGPLLVGPERTDDAVAGDADCYRIRGKSRKTPYTLMMGAQTRTVEDESITFWIDKATYLLRKVEEDRTFDTYREKSVTTYTPEFDVDIPATDLAFDAPAAKP